MDKQDQQPQGIDLRTLMVFTYYRAYGNNGFPWWKVFQDKVKRSNRALVGFLIMGFIFNPRYQFTYPHVYLSFVAGAAVLWNFFFMMKELASWHAVYGRFRKSDIIGWGSAVITVVLLIAWFMFIASIAPVAYWYL